MKKLINFVAIAFVAISLSACGEKNGSGTDTPPDQKEFTMYKSWQLAAWPDAESTFPKDVYITFDDASDTFVLYQNVETVGYVKFTGSFAFDEASKKLTGEYSDGKPWKESYTRTDMTVQQMNLLGSSGATSIFNSKAIPEGVVNGAAPASVTRGIEFERFF